MLIPHFTSGTVSLGWSPQSLNMAGNCRRQTLPVEKIKRITLSFVQIGLQGFFGCWEFWRKNMVLKLWIRLLMNYPILAGVISTC